jgi:hypothetical protein
MIIGFAGEREYWLEPVSPSVATRK